MSVKRKLKPRVIALLGNEAQNRNTLATLLRHDVNVVGVCIADDKIGGMPLKYIIKSVRRRGWVKTSSQILARLVYLVRNKKRDIKLKSGIFDDEKNKQTISERAVPTVFGDSFSSQRDFIKEMEPEILVVHTRAWVGKDIRDLEGVKYIIGGHPGITPMYRGAHSPFWAIYNEDNKNIGWTCFLVDEGIDTGPVVEQGFILPSKEETYMSLSWKGMVEIALSQVRAIDSYSVNGKIFSKPHIFIPDSSEYFVPTLGQQIRFWMLQKQVK